MNRYLLVVVALFAVSIMHSAPDQVQQARAEIEAQYAKRSRAIEAHRVRGVLDVLAPGFTMRYLDGRSTGRREWEEGLAQRMVEMEGRERQAKAAGGEWKNPERVTTVIQSIALHGDRATVAAVTTTLTSAVYPKGLTHRGTMEETSEDTWVKTALGWRLLTIEQLRNRTTTDESRARPKPK